MYSISAERELGKSLRRMRVTRRWWGIVSATANLASEVGERAIDHASRLRKRKVEEIGIIEVDVSDWMGRRDRVDWMEDDVAWPIFRIESTLFSSQRVSMFPDEKSGLPTIPRRRSRLVFTPTTRTSSNARRAF